MYYCKLLLSILPGFYDTANPLDLNWRWKTHRFDRGSGSSGVGNFHDIWRYSEGADKSQSAESGLIALIARRRLIRYLQ